jgi:tetratricopeptide (TPR) repeat protein
LPFPPRQKPAPLRSLKTTQREGTRASHGKKEFDQAIKHFRQALDTQPDYPEALDNVGKALDAGGEKKKKRVPTLIKR